ncbi:DDE-type integrase/transposase/recombinase [Stenotrophobium rhamnosiphilum]|uniref:Integrase catalytic domain-containing protein n=1 Tax=Stenotrophobium rhamnosiphilum TaxID=2029166 RepID=A0A2T5MCM4_9GAMM|nr:DDE-type integrase/transposase/recombinase [Stenotrophobium rhamnosiphilum]PTU30307.1 hypothetical protein CJD38_15285 [Stenotrophobium rhamnosiphilum]
MASLIFNQLYRIKTDESSEVWRAVCSMTEREESILVRLPIEIGHVEVQSKEINLRKVRLVTRRITFKETTDLIQNGEMEAITIHFDRNIGVEDDDLSVAERKVYELRRSVMSDFCNPAKLQPNFETGDTFGKLVSKALARSTVSKQAVYYWLKLLCFYGFNVSSLRSQFRDCGAPGIPREYMSPESKPGIKTLREMLGIETTPQRAIKIVEREIIISKLRALLDQTTKFGDAYSKLVAELWISEWTFIEGKIEPVMPKVGTFPSLDQVRTLYDAHINKIERLQKRVSPLAYARSHRGLIGYARDGVAGPGHLFAMDSTRADTDLRSSINRHWLVGRPFIYWIIDVWSTAIVGFYVCLAHPSWQNARIALFCSVYGANELTDIWGMPMDLGLDPYPTLPKALLTDRGEYLSEGALLTATDMSFDLAINSPYRADLKGIVEVFNRIQKDDAYGLIPGAMDARKQAYENRSNKKMSAMTLWEFVKYIRLFAHYKNSHADRSHLCTDEMRAQGVPPTPAGIWKFGHAIGIGFKSPYDPEILVRKLLSPLDMTVNRSGLEYGGLRFLNSEIDMRGQSAQARNFGAFEINAFHIPSAPQQIWATLPNDKLRNFTLAPNSAMPAKSSFLEHYDALAFTSISKPSRAAEALKAKISYAFQVMQMSDAARLAVKNEVLPPFALNVHEARAFEESAPVLARHDMARIASSTKIDDRDSSREIVMPVIRSATDDLIHQIMFDQGRP